MLDNDSDETNECVFIDANTVALHMPQTFQSDKDKNSSMQLHSIMECQILEDRNHHQERHHLENPKPYKCLYDGCEKAFANKSGLNRHKKKHSYQIFIKFTFGDCKTFTLDVTKSDTLGTLKKKIKAKAGISRKEFKKKKAGIRLIVNGRDLVDDKSIVSD